MKLILLYQSRKQSSDVVTVVHATLETATYPNQNEMNGNSIMEYSRRLSNILQCNINRLPFILI